MSIADIDRECGAGCTARDGAEPGRLHVYKAAPRPGPGSLTRILDLCSPASNLAKARAFYGALLGLDVVMDMGWIMTFASETAATPQISVATEGGSGTAVLDLSIEVDNVDEIYKRAKAAGFEITYCIADEPWGVRRFYVRDPLGKVVNILAHV